jgi:hypothetical protein
MADPTLYPYPPEWEQNLYQKSETIHDLPEFGKSTDFPHLLAILQDPNDFFPISLAKDLEFVELQFGLHHF